MTPSIVLSCRCRSVSYDRRALAASLSAALPLCLKSSIRRGGGLHLLVEIPVTVLGRPAMARAHRDFLKTRGATDVITFPYGEILLCGPVAAARAPEFDHSTTTELLTYGIHGLLHLSGYDDLTPSGFQEMAARQSEIVDAVSARI